MHSIDRSSSSDTVIIIIKIPYWTAPLAWLKEAPPDPILILSLPPVWLPLHALWRTSVPQSNRVALPEASSTSR